MLVCQFVGRRVQSDEPGAHDCCHAAFARLLSRPSPGVCSRETAALLAPLRNRRRLSPGLGPHSHKAARRSTGKDRDRSSEQYQGSDAERHWYIGLHIFRSEEHTSELQSLMRISYAVFCLKKKTNYKPQTNN